LVLAILGAVFGFSLFAAGWLVVEVLVVQCTLRVSRTPEAAGEPDLEVVWSPPTDDLASALLLILAASMLAIFGTILTSALSLAAGWRVVEFSWPSLSSLVEAPSVD